MTAPFNCGMRSVARTLILSKGILIGFHQLHSLQMVHTLCQDLMTAVFDCGMQSEECNLASLEDLLVSYHQLHSLQMACIFYQGLIMVTFDCGMQSTVYTSMHWRAIQV